MDSSVLDDRKHQDAPQPRFDRGAAVTRSLLGYGVLAGVFYLVVSLIQAFVRDGFDLSRHALSLLANGPGGWVQTTNFALTGLMVIAAAVGFARVLGVNGRGVSWFLGSFGASMIAAAIFPADPVDGFPVGTPRGMPTAISSTGLAHFAAGALGFLCLAVACFLASRMMSRRKQPRLSRLSLIAGLSVFLGFFGGTAFATSSAGILGIWFAVVVGWGWLAAMSVHLYRVSPNPNCVP